MSALLEVRDVRRGFGGVAAVDGATLDVAEGSITALIGPNGAGKTTLFNVVSGFLKPDAGEVRFDGRRVDHRPPHAVARAGLVRTFQTPRALTRVSVLENLMVGAPDQPGERLSRVFATPRAVGRHRAGVVEQARELLALVGLERLAGDYAGTLSGGQRKLLELARALMTRPRLLLLDEPMAGVNPTLGRTLLDHVAMLRRDHGLTFAFIEHDLDVVMSVSDRVIVLNAGRVIATGTPAEVRADPRVVDAYLGTRRAGP